MTKNKDPMLQELGTLINNRTATQKAQAPFNEQAAILIDDALDLIKQVLVKHSAAVLEEMHDQIVARNQRIKQLEDELEWEDTEKSNYCQILTALGMEEEGDPVEGLNRLNGSVATLESECNQLNDMTIKQWALIEDLASMCRRLSYSVKRSGDDKLAHQCVVLLKKYDLGGSVLRNMEGPADLCPKPAPGLEVDARGVLVKKPELEGGRDGD